LNFGINVIVKDVEYRLALFLIISWGIQQWTIVAMCLVIFYPIKILLSKPEKYVAKSWKIEKAIPVSLYVERGRGEVHTD
jgi:hypothetical protein